MLLQNVGSRLPATVLLFALSSSAITAAESDEQIAGLEGGSFSSLTNRELELLTATRDGLQRLVSAYSSLNVVCHVTQTVTTADPESPTATSEAQVAVRWTDKQFRADSVQLSAQPAVGRILLCDGLESWDLHQDPGTSKYFVYQHGNDRADCRWEQWWAGAPYSFLTKNLLDDLFIENPLSKITSVRELQSDDGEMLVEVVRDLHPAAKDLPGDEQHDVPMQRFLFYRDHFSALKEAEAIGYIVGTPFQSRRIQRTTYEPFQSDRPPRIKSILVERAKRHIDSRSDDAAWNVFRKDEFHIERLEFADTDQSVFDITKIVDFSGHVHSAPGRRHVWIFMLSGIVFLIGWWVLRGRSKESESPPGKI